MNNAVATDPILPEPAPADRTADTAADGAAGGGGAEPLESKEGGEEVEESYPVSVTYCGCTSLPLYILCVCACACACA